MTGNVQLYLTSAGFARTRALFWMEVRLGGFGVGVKVWETRRVSLQP